MKAKIILGAALILSSIAFAESKDLSCANKADTTLTKKTDQQLADHRLREIFAKDAKGSTSGSSTTSR
jgi:hypothetical protein